MSQLQLERLQALLARLKRNVRRYREMLGDVQVESLSELDKLPVTEGKDLVASFPYGMFALPLQEVTRLQSAVGPDGKQLVVGHTRNDLTHWARLVARQLVAAGVIPSDVMQVCFGGGIFEKALGYMLGAESIEVSVIPDDPYHIEYQLAMLQNYRTTVLVTSPANAWELVRLLDTQRADPQTFYLRTILLSRAIPTAERLEMKRGLWADVRCSFGVPEILDPGLCVECPAGNFHVNEDHFLVEIKNGELLVTTLCREATPLLRYRTHVACEIRRTPCLCGRTGAVLVPGERTDGRLLVNEMPLYRAQIADVLAKTRAAGQPFKADISEKRIVVSLEVNNTLFADTMRSLVNLKQEIENAFLSRLGIPADIRFASPDKPQET
jgi:phenylacetate-CoA ligase